MAKERYFVCQKISILYGNQPCCLSNEPYFVCQKSHLLYIKVPVKKFAKALPIEGPCTEVGSFCQKIVPFAQILFLFQKVCFFCKRAKEPYIYVSFDIHNRALLTCKIRLF